MSVPQYPPLPHDDGVPRGEFFNRVERTGLTPNQIAQAEDPPGAGAAEVIRQARPHEALGKTGPRTPEGKEQSALNSSKHRCTATHHTAWEEVEYQVVLKEEATELLPSSPAEIAVAERCAESRFMREKCSKAIQKLAFDLIDEDKARRKAPHEAKIVVLEASLFLWEGLNRPTLKLPFGKGYGDQYPILLKDLDPETSIKNLRSPKARIFASLHASAQATPRLLELHEKHRMSQTFKGQDREYDEYLDGLNDLKVESSRLQSWVMQHVADLRHDLERAKRELAKVDTTPADPNLVLLLSDEYRKLRRYQDDHERAYYRNRRAFNMIRGQLMTTYDRGMDDLKKKYDVMFKVGPLGIHLPDSLSGLCPYDQIEAMVRVLLREQRYFSPNERNEFRRIAEITQPYENEGISAASWNEADSDGKGGTRVIGGEKSLRPAPGAPKPPDAPDLPR